MVQEIIPSIHLTLEGKRGCGSTALFVLDLSTRWRWVVSSTLRPLYTCRRSSRAHWIWRWLCAKGSMRAAGHKNLSPPRIKTRVFLFKLWNADRTSSNPVCRAFFQHEISTSYNFLRPCLMKCVIIQTYSRISRLLNVPDRSIVSFTIKGTFTLHTTNRALLIWCLNSNATHVFIYRQ